MTASAARRSSVSSFRLGMLASSRRAFRTRLPLSPLSFVTCVTSSLSAAPYSYSTDRKSVAIRSMASLDGLGCSTASKNSRKARSVHSRGRPEQVEQVPDLDRVHLHRGRGEQYQPLGPVSECAHELEEGVRTPFLRRARRATPRVVRFVEHDEVPRLGIFQELGRTVPPAHEVARGDDDWLLVPLAPVDLALVRSPGARATDTGRASSRRRWASSG